MPPDLTGPLALLVVETPSEIANVYLCPNTTVEGQRLRLSTYRKSHYSFHAINHVRAIEHGPFPLLLPQLLEVQGTAKFFNHVEEAASCFDRMYDTTTAIELLEAAVSTLKQRSAQVMARESAVTNNGRIMLEPIPLEKK